MIVRSVAAAGVLLVATAAAAQTPMPPTNFEQAAYITCREAHAMNPESRKVLAIFLAEHAARYHGVRIPDDERGTQIAYLVRGGCTLSPDAHLFAVIDKAIVAEMGKLPKR
jgi:hypothetical protein